MADEPKDQKFTPLEPSKDIEDLLKELPKIDVSRPASPAPPPKPPLPNLPPPKPQFPPPPPVPPPKSPSLPGASLPQTKAQEDPEADASHRYGAGKFKSYVRTMEEDLEAAKKGLKPEPKPFEIKPPPGIQRPNLPAPLPTRPPLPPPEIKLGPSEKTRPMELPKQISPFPPPKRTAVSSKLLIIILVILAAGAALWFFIAREREPEITLVTPTPTPETTPPPIPPAMDEILGPPNTVTIASTDNFLVSLNNFIKTIPLAKKQFAHIEIWNENNLYYSLEEIFEELQIKPPSQLKENLDLDITQWSWFVYGQQETFDPKGNLVIEASPVNPKAKASKFVLIAKTDSPEILRSSLNAWEITMTDELKKLFNLDPKKTTSEVFLDNIYSGADIRYRNFPFADNSIDYAIVSLPKFNANYFVLTNSRESIYSAIDLLNNQ